MATSAGPNLINDGLIVALDATRQETKYYPGEPTTNIVPSPSANGRFTTSNNWASYNTNQYNSNNDFDIGTIGSVSNNIVTLSSVGHNIRSFDVLNPATTGGGVTAGTNYVVKKISSTTFSLHAYNGSQNGSQGYINPSTNFYKVHSSADSLFGVHGHLKTCLHDQSTKSLDSILYIRKYKKGFKFIGSHINSHAKFGLNIRADPKRCVPFSTNCADR